MPLTAATSTSKEGTASDMRCIAHLDMDCFYAQVEAVRLGIDCRTTPFVCVQWGSFIAVNYPARALGIQRFRQTPDEVRREHPELQMSHVATYGMGELEYGYPASSTIQTHKVSLEPYRHASRQIFGILRSEPGVSVGKAGIDEAYIDVTEAAQRELEELRAAAAGAAGGCDVALDPLRDVMAPSTRLIDDRRDEMEAWFAQHGTSLAAVFDAPMRALLRGECGRGVGGSRGFCVDAADADYTARCLLLCAASRVVLRLRQRIYAELHYDCSAGIAHNRVLAKCISATHKPNQQTLLLPDRGASALFDLPLSRLRGFGGKFGAAVSAVCGGATAVRELWLVPMAQLHALDGTAVEVSEDDDDDGDTDQRPQSEKRKAEAAGTGGVAEYVYYRIRGLNGDTVADPALPRAMEASKIFHPSCESWAAAQLWIAPLAGELWHRFRHYEDRYAREGRSVVVYIRTYVSPAAAQHGWRTQSYRRHTALPVDMGNGAALLAELGGRELVRLMAEITKMPIAALTCAPQGTTGATSGESGIEVPMPPLRIIGLSIIGLRPRVGSDVVEAPQRSLKDMFTSLAAARPKRTRSPSAKRSPSSSSSGVCVVGDAEDRNGGRDSTRGSVSTSRGGSHDDRKEGPGSRSAAAPSAVRIVGESSPPPRGTLDAFFHSQRRPPVAVAVAVATAEDAQEAPQLIRHACSSTSIVEISSGEEEGE